MNYTTQKSKIARDHMLLAKCIDIINKSGDQGIKRGMLFFKAGLNLTQFHTIHSILKDYEDIEWIKSKSTYYSMRYD